MGGVGDGQETNMLHLFIGECGTVPHAAIMQIDLNSLFSPRELITAHIGDGRRLCHRSLERNFDCKLNRAVARSRTHTHHVDVHSHATEIE